MKISRCFWILLFIWVAACMPSTVAPEITTAPTTPILSAKTNEFVEKTQTLEHETNLTSAGLQNTSYYAPFLEKTVQLRNGEFSESNENGTSTVTLLSQMAIGDLNGDKIDDAAVLLAENGGGSGVFVSLVVIVSQDAQFTQIGSIQIDDRPRISSLVIEDEKILLEGAIHRINDAMSEPTFRVKQTYRLLENTLTLMSQNSTISVDQERLIDIETPEEGGEISDSVQIKGSMAIAPFENNLRLVIYDLSGTLLFETGFMVNAEDLGGPATFDNLVSLMGIPLGIQVRLELAELSMADGSLLTSNSVVVTKK